MHGQAGGRGGTRIYGQVVGTLERVSGRTDERTDCRTNANEADASQPMSGPAEAGCAPIHQSFVLSKKYRTLI